MRAVLRTMQRQRLGGWLCLLACFLHLLAPLCPASAVLHHPPNAAVGTTTYIWDLANRLMGVTLPDGRSYGYEYDYRGRRVGIVEGGSIASPVMTAISFSEGLSVAEWEAPVGGSFATAATVGNGVSVQQADKFNEDDAWMYLVKLLQPDPVGTQVVTLKPAHQSLMKAKHRQLHHSRRIKRRYFQNLNALVVWSSAKENQDSKEAP